MSKIILVKEETIEVEEVYKLCTLAKNRAQLETNEPVYRGSGVVNHPTWQLVRVVEALLRERGEA